ncbi:MAG TPA: penicillin acylase family protein [Planctomycetota bacterium]|nr:penicillin acylase family protein [Planctomycetota bacterium]
MIRAAAVLSLLCVPPSQDGVRVTRDAWGVPRIEARTWREAFRAEGRVEAEDRWAQMETFRRAAKGESAELHGPAALPNDRDRRLRGYTEAELRRMFESGGERFRAILAAYTAGVNDALAARPEPRPRPWSETDCVAIGILMARRFGEAGDHELTVARVQEQMQKKLGPEDARKIIDDLLRLSDPAAPTTLHDHLKEAPPARDEQGLRRAPGLGDEAWAAYRAELAAIADSRAALGVPSYFGSNAWVAAPAKSATGRPLLYAGPMMGFGAPSICNEIRLKSEDGLDAAGMSFPGVPGVMIGWNARLAWTTTSGGADLVDVFTLELNPENPEQYRHKGAWRDFEVVEHTMPVKGAPDETLRVRRWVHGPLAGEPDRKALRAHGLRMSFWMKEASTFEAVMDMNFAGSLEAFEAASRKVVTSHNFFCATADGRIGFWYCGAHPVRAQGHDVRFPQAGDGSMEWTGILDPSRWPRAVDPPHGFFANWNNKPAREWEPGGFGKVFWGKKIIDVLEAEPKLTFERFGEIARLTAYHAYLADYFKPHFLAAAKGSDDPEIGRAAEILSAWDHQERDGEAAPALFERALRGLVQRMFSNYVDPFLLATKDVQRYVVDPLLYVLEGDRAPVKLKFDYLRGRDLPTMLRSSLKDAMRGGEAALAWKEPSINFKGAVGAVKSKNGRGTWHAVVEMGPDGPRAVSVCAPGQSEDPASPHYRDQLELFERWAYKPFVW